MNIKQILKENSIGKNVVIKGWVRTRRDSKAGLSFIEVNDGSCLGNLQVIAENSLSNYDTEIIKATIGSSIIVEGIIVESPATGQKCELKANSINVLGYASNESYPLQKKKTSLEFLRKLAHLRPRTNTFGAMARVRNELSKATHDFFQNNGFIYLNTPIITASDCEGAGQMFNVTTFDLNNVPKLENGEIDFEQDFFGKHTSLTVSGQLEAETYALALSKVYTFGPTFRAENSNTTRHLAEFWMIEPEVAFNDINDNMDLAQAYIKYIINNVLTNCPEDLQFFNDRYDKGIIDTLRHIVNSDFKRITYTQAIDILLASSKTFEFPVAFGLDLQSEHERFLTEEHFKEPVIVYNYPKEIKAFYMRLNDDNKTVAAMDVLLPKVGELIGGSQREERYDVLLARMKEANLPQEEYWWYLDLRRYGSVPHSGFGLGLERMVQFVTGLGNIRDVIPYPRFPGSCEF